MQRAGDAMKQIHGKLTVDKVDQTMYVAIAKLQFCVELLISLETGTNCASKTP
jgi:hypothetical protein